MLREMAESIERLSQNSPLLLVLEDLHWSDYSTLDLIAHLSRRRDPARVMIIGTYRPVDVILANHPLKDVKRELQVHRLCHELPLEYLSEEAVADYLTARFPHHQFPARLRRAIHRRTEGNPLFMVNLVDFLVDRNVIAEGQGSWDFCRDCAEVEHGIPSNIRELIEKQMENLSPEERMVLEAASATGMDFSIVAVAAGLDKSIDWVEKHCEELALRHRFFSLAWLGELPDGTVSPRHRFNHVLYREVPYALIPPMRRVQIHQRIAERGIQIYGNRAGEIAAELAMHFEQSRDWARALEFLALAAKNAVRRSAHREAAELARRGLEVLKSLPDTNERAHQEVTLRMMECTSLIAVKGFAAAEVDKIQALGRQLFSSGGASAQLSNMLYLLLLFDLFSGRINASQETAQQLLKIAEDLADPALIMEAHRAMGATMVEQGKCVEAIEHFDIASGLYPAHRNHRHILTIAHDCKVICECFAARALWALGDRDGALSRMQGALAFAKELAQPRSWVLTAHFAAQLHQFRGEPLQAQTLAREVARLADEYGMDFWVPFGTFDLGWCEAELGDAERGIEQMRQGLDAHMASGAKLWCPQFLALLARQLAKTGRPQEGLDTVTRAVAMAEESGELYALAELSDIRRELESQQHELASAK
jgi:predicted ATPase